MSDKKYELIPEFSFSYKKEKEFLKEITNRYDWIITHNFKIEEDEEEEEKRYDKTFKNKNLWLAIQLSKKYDNLEKMVFGKYHVEIFDAELDLNNNVFLTYEFVPNFESAYEDKYKLLKLVNWAIKKTYLEEKSDDYKNIEFEGHIDYTDNELLENLKLNSPRINSKILDLGEIQMSRKYDELSPSFIFDSSDCNFANKVMQRYMERSNLIRFLLDQRHENLDLESQTVILEPNDKKDNQSKKNSIKTQT